MYTLGPIATIFVFVIRRVMLWLAILAGAPVWLAYLRWRRQASFAQYLGWADVNIVAFLLRTVLNPWAPSPRIGYVPASKMNTVTHRVSYFDDLV